MKPIPSERRIRERMAPGVLTLDGLLGNDPRSLADITADDAAQFAAAGVEPAAVAQFLQELFDQAEGALETRITLCGGRVAARVTEGMGRTPCPYACGVRSRKAVLEIEAAGRTLRITPLGIHLLAAHGFLQGRGSPFRVEPEALLALYRSCL